MNSRAAASTSCSPTRGSGWFAPLEKATDEDYEQNFGTNVRGTWLSVQEALPLLNVGASVILNGSIRADDGWENFCCRQRRGSDPA